MLQEGSPLQAIVVPQVHGCRIEILPIAVSKDEMIMQEISRTLALQCGF